MRRKGNCWDNAVMARFFLNLKMERVWQQDYANHVEAEAVGDMADHIVGFYNAVRLHSKLGNLPPNAYEQHMAINPPIDVFEKKPDALCRRCPLVWAPAPARRKIPVPT